MSRRGDPGAGPQGLAVVDKPAGWTSHDVVARARKLLGTRRVGHAGTLDPDATGVLLLGVGRVTRLLRFITALPKTYTTDIILGTETDTLDASGTVVATHDMSSITEDQVRAAAGNLTGDIMQVPPMVSAVRVDGQRLHVLARAGISVERQPRPVTVMRFDVEPMSGSGMPPMRWRATVECSRRDRSAITGPGRRSRHSGWWGSTPRRVATHGHRPVHRTRGCGARRP